MSNLKQLAHSLEDKIRTKDVILQENVSFDSLLLPNNILKGLAKHGFKKPSPIQIKAIPIGRCGFDLLVKSKSGTGKTLVFVIVALESIDLSKTRPQVIVVAPTREIAVQIGDVFKDIGVNFDGLVVENFIGGFSIESDKLKCKSCHVAVGTPGRIKQLIKIGSLNVSAVRIFVLDEADKLMENSFQNDINEIYNSLPSKKQVIMSSATYTKELETLLTDYMLSPTYVSAELETPLLLGLKQFVRIIKSSNNVVQQTKVKNEELLKIFTLIPFTQCLVFSNYQTRAESISNFLNRNSWNSLYISGAQNQTDRLAALSDLKQFHCRILLSTDLTARGIDAANVDLVINYDVPIDAMTYLHRMGRAGRYGSSGICINLASEGPEVQLLQNILGVIGGTNLSVPKLDDSFNLKEVSNENLLFGIVPENSDVFNQFKAEVRKLKAKSAKKKNKSDKIKDDSDTVKEHLMDTDPMSILGQLAEGNFEMSNGTDGLNSSPRINGETVQNNDSSQALFNELASYSVSFENKTQSHNNVKQTQSRVEKLDTTKILTELAETGSTKIEPSSDPSCDVFSKNRALFSVAKSLSNCETGNDDVQFISQYLNSLRNKDEFETSKVLKTECETSKEHVLENIFSMAYKFALNPSEIHWRDLLSEEERNKLETGQVKEDSEQDEDEDEDEDEEYYDDEEDEDYNFEIEKDIEVHYDTKEAQDDYSFMKWIPVEPPQESKENMSVVKNNNFSVNQQSNSANQSNDKYCDRYGDYFKHCSENLWQTGLAFDTVEHFDQWFWYDWQAQVSAVRNCIQQKIYVEEMAKYAGYDKRREK